MTEATELSGGLQALVNDFSAARDYADGISMEQKDLHRLIDILAIFQKLATNLEIEVRCLRDMEAGKQANDFLEGEALAHLADLLPDTGDNVVRPSFGRRT